MILPAPLIISFTTQDCLEAATRLIQLSEGTWEVLHRPGGYTVQTRAHQGVRQLELLSPEFQTLLGGDPHTTIPGSILHVAASASHTIRNPWPSSFECMEQLTVTAAQAESRELFWVEGITLRVAPPVRSIVDVLMVNYLQWQVVSTDKGSLYHDPIRGQSLELVDAELNLPPVPFAVLTFEVPRTEMRIIWNKLEDLLSAAGIHIVDGTVGGDWHMAFGPSLAPFSFALRPGV